ncbi:MAG: glycosyltransferase family 2 protein [Vulcanisaeta sp.]
MTINYALIIIILYLIITILAFYPIIYQLILLALYKRYDSKSRNDNYEHTNREGASRVFLVIPAKSEPLDLIEQSMKAASINQYINHVDAVYILDNYSAEIINIIKSLGEKYGVKVIHRDKPYGYKGGALNHVVKRLKLTDDDYMLVLDVDSLMSPETLNKLIMHAGSANALVSRWVARNNNDSLLSRGQWVGYLLFFRILMALDKLIGWVPILGSGSLINVGAIRRVGYWPEDVLEDVELGVRFFINDLRVRYINDALVNVEVPTNYYGFLRQQLRWSFGVGRVVRKYFWKILRKRHGITVLLYLGQYFAYVLQLISILMLVIMSMVGLNIPLWAFISLASVAIPALTLYLYYLLRLDKENGGNPVRDVFAINTVNLAFIMALPRIAIANLMGLLGIGKIEWIPTPKGSRRWHRESVNLLPESMMVILMITAFILAIIHALWLNLLIILPYMAGHIRGLWRLIKGSI